MTKILELFRGLVAKKLTGDASSRSSPVKRSNFSVTDVCVRLTVQAQLREYQQKGFCWLTSILSHGFGGILADDMVRLLFRGHLTAYLGIRVNASA